MGSQVFQVDAQDFRGFAGKSLSQVARCLIQGVACTGNVSYAVRVARLRRGGNRVCYSRGGDSTEIGNGVGGQPGQVTEPGVTGNRVYRRVWPWLGGCRDSPGGGRWSCTGPHSQMRHTRPGVTRSGETGHSISQWGRGSCLHRPGSHQGRGNGK